MNPTLFRGKKRPETRVRERQLWEGWNLRLGRSRTSQLTMLANNRMGVVTQLSSALLSRHPEFARLEGWSPFILVFKVRWMEC